MYHFSKIFRALKLQNGLVLVFVYEDVVARHASRGADSKLSNALDDGSIFYHHVVFSQFSIVVDEFIADISNGW